MAHSINTTLQDIAIRLSWDLHSGAKENIISSLLSASINEASHFREWFLNEIEYDQENRRGLYSEPNQDVGDITAAIKRTRPNYKNKRLPRRPDVLIHSGDDEDRREVREICRYRRLSEDKKGQLARALKRTRVVFIEVKHTALSDGDGKKYNNLINGLSGCQNAGHLGDKHRFVILSAHTDRAKSRIVAKVANEEQTTADEKRWHSLFGREQAGVVHITLEHLYKSIKGLNKEHRTSADASPILQLFEHYLALHVGIFDGLHPYDWTDRVRRAWRGLSLFSWLSNASSNSFGGR